MTDQMDYRLKELVTKLAASAPAAPPFPQTTGPAPVRRSPVPAWALSVAGAVAVLLVIGVPFLLFSGGRSGDSATTLPSTPPTTLTPAPPTTVPADDGPDLISSCVPAGLRVRALEGDGAAGHVVTPLEVANVSGSPCRLDNPLSVTGIGSNEEEVAAALGTYIPIGADAGPLLQAGESRTMLLETGTGCEGGRVMGPAAVEARITLATGDLTVPYSGDLGCMFSYSDFGLWLDTEAPSAYEVSLADALVAFAEDPSTTRGPAFADTVTLTLGPAIARTESGAALVEDPALFSFDSADGFRAYVGPFSALDLLATGRPTALDAGPHDHCAGPPMPINDAFTGLRHLSIQPTDATSCLEWWTVDLFLNADGEISGVTLDLWEP